MVNVSSKIKNHPLVETGIKVFIGIDLVVLVLIFLNNYLGFESVPAPGRRMNNPLGALIISLLLLLWVRPDLQSTWFAQIKRVLGALKYKLFLFSVLIGIDIFLIAMHFIFPDRIHWYLEVERGYATYFSSIQLLFLASLIWTIKYTRQSNPGIRLKALHWNLVAGLFLYLCLDEVLGMHDQIGKLAKSLSPDSTTYHLIHEWLWIYAPFILGAIGFLGFVLIEIGKYFRRAQMFLLCGLCFWVSVIILEALGKSSGAHYTLFVGLEEGAELLGATFFVIGFGEFISFLLRNPTVGDQR